jgi:hypothetical protein
MDLSFYFVTNIVRPIIKVAALKDNDRIMDF